MPDAKCRNRYTREPGPQRSDVRDCSQTSACSGAPFRGMAVCPAEPWAKAEWLLQAHAALCEEVSAIRHFLAEGGVASVERFSARLHRQRFAAIQKASNWRPDQSLVHIARTGDIVGCIRSFAAQAEIVALSATARDVQASVESTFAKIYLCGGVSDVDLGLNSAERLELRSGVWEALPDMPNRRTGSAGGVIGGKLYLCGGASELAERSVFCFNPAEPARPWSILTMMSAPRVWHAAAASNGLLYVCGGEGNQKVLSSTLCFNPRASNGKGSWTELRPMLESRSGLAVAAIIGRLIVCGGSSELGAVSPSNSAELVFCTDDSRMALPPMLEARSGHAAAAIGRYVYVCGGRNGDQTLSSMERFQLGGDRWEAMPGMSVPRWLPVAAVAAQKLYVCGGRAETSESEGHTSMEYFDLPNQRWESQSSMPSHRTSAVIGVIFL